MASTAPTAIAHLCDACTHVALGGFYADELTVLMGAAYVAGKRAALTAMGDIVGGDGRDRVNHVAMPCAACGSMVNDTTVFYYVAAAPAPVEDDAPAAYAVRVLWEGQCIREDAPFDADSESSAWDCFDNTSDAFTRIGEQGVTVQLFNASGDVLAETHID